MEFGHEIDYRIDNQPAGDFSGGMSSHTIGDYKQPKVVIEMIRIFVALSFPADIRDARRLN